MAKEHICPLALYAQLAPKLPALITDDAMWTYSECNEIVHDLYDQLKKRDITARSRVAFIARKTPHAVLLFFALWRLKAIACPLSFREPDIANLMEKVGATHQLEAESLSLYTSWDRFPTHLADDDLATCILTSGSSGNPKAACHTLGNYFYNALGALEFLDVTANAKWLLSLPLFHVGGISILLRMFLAGGAVVLSELPLADALERHSITHLSLVPTQLIRLLDAGQEISKSLTHLLLGGAPIAPHLLKRAQERSVSVITTYGMTEMSSIITAAKNPTAEHVGTALPFRDYMLSASGEILVQGRTLFQGYRDAEPVSREEWFATKDLGRVDSDGNLHIVGRSDRLFISGGENIQPEEIERALYSIPGIAQAAVFPVADEEFGHRPAAIIQDDTASHTLESIKEALTPLLPSFKHPIHLIKRPADDSLKMILTKISH